MAIVDPMRVRIAVAMFITVAVLGIALAAMAITDSPVPGWIAAGSVLAWMIGRLLIWGIGGADDEDLDLDL
jgi:hypothetical protein